MYRHIGINKISGVWHYTLNCWQNKPKQQVTTFFWVRNHEDSASTVHSGRWTVNLVPYAAKQQLLSPVEQTMLRPSDDWYVLMLADNLDLEQLHKGCVKDGKVQLGIHIMISSVRSAVPGFVACVQYYSTHMLPTVAMRISGATR